MLKLREIGAKENQDTYKRAFDKAAVNFQAVCQEAETFLESFSVPKVEEEPDYPAIAASMERELLDVFKYIDDQLKDAEGDKEKTLKDALWKHVESLLRAVEDKLARALISTREVARLDPESSEEVP